MPEEMSGMENKQWFTPTERINGFIYIKDGEGRFVSVNGKIKRYKSTTKAAMMIFRLESARNYSLRNKGE